MGNATTPNEPGTAARARLAARLRPWLAMLAAGTASACGGGGGSGSGSASGGAAGLPSVSVADALAAEGGPTGARFAVTLSAASSSVVTVDYSLGAVTATAPGDFNATGGTLSIPAGATSGTIEVPIVDDGCFESDETFNVTLANLSANVTLAKATAVGRIASDDEPAFITLSDPRVTEGDAGHTTLTFAIAADRAECSDITATFTTNSVTATVDEDFLDTSGTFVLPAGAVSGTIAVAIVGDTQIEAHETLTLNLANLSPNATATKLDGFGVIDNDDFPRVSVLGASVVEGNVGSTPLSFLVALEAPTSSDVVVAFATAEGTATTADNDYLAVSGLVTIPQGATQASVEVSVVGDSTIEADESFGAAIGNLQGDAVLFVAAATATIIDDDTNSTELTSVSVRSASIDEGDAGSVLMRFAVDVAPAAADPIELDFATRDGDARADEDYVAAAGRFTIPAGALFAELTIAVLGDGEQESDETFFVDLGNVTSNAVLHTAQVTGRINDDDAPSAPRFSINDPSVTEGDSGTTPMLFFVSLSSGPSANVSVDYATVDGTADSLGGSDYVPASGTLTFGPGETQKTISVTVNGDTVVEANETFRLVLSNVVGDAVLVDDSGTGLIGTDDFLPALSVGDASYLEGDLGASYDLVFAVTIDRAASAAVTFDFATSDGTAIGGSDYVATAGGGVIPAGALATTIAVRILGDTDIEPDEQLFVDVANVSANATVAKAHATGLVINDDSATSGWQPATALDTDPRDSRLPVIEMNASGDAVAIWRSSTASFGALYGRRYTQTTGWSSVELVTADAVDAFSFDATVNASGAAIAAWNANGAKVRHYDPTAGWGAVVTLDSTNVALDRISVDNNDSGQAAITTRNNYAGSAPPYKDMFASLHDPVSASWSAPLTLLEFDSAATFLSDVAVDAAGSVVAVWSQGAAYASRYSADSLLWSTPQPLTVELSPGVQRPGDFPIVVTDADGNAFAAWYESAGGPQAYVARYDSGTDTWSTTPFVLNSNAARKAVAPRLAVDNDGDAVVIWLEDDGTGGGTPSYDIWERRYDAATGTWSAPGVVANIDLTLRLVASRFDSPSLAINDLGNALVVWSQNVGGRYTIRATTYDGEWTAPETVSDATSSDASLPRVVMDRASRGMAIWQQVNPTTGDYEIWASEYRLSAAP